MSGVRPFSHANYIVPQLSVCPLIPILLKHVVAGTTEAVRTRTTFFGDVGMT